jgi:metal-responsive CopG/Arc/MetJ family transcriptional regulator
MVRKFSPPPRTVLVRSSIRLPIGMKETLERTMLAQGVSLKRRSSWIASACEAFLAIPDHEELVREEFYDGRTMALPLALNSVLAAQLSAVAERISSEQRLFDRSSVIRTAITQAILAAAGRQLVRGVPPGDTVGELS